MKTMLITLLAMNDDEPVAECQADLDLTTFEILEISDETFVSADDLVYEGFAIEVNDKIYPVSVDYIPFGNEFMVMDADAIDAIAEYAAANPELVEGEVDLDEDEEAEDA